MDSLTQTCQVELSASSVFSFERFLPTSGRLILLPDYCNRGGGPSHPLVNEWLEIKVTQDYRFISSKRRLCVCVCVKE